MNTVSKRPLHEPDVKAQMLETISKLGGQTALQEMAQSFVGYRTQLHSLITQTPTSFGVVGEFSIEQAVELEFQKREIEHLNSLVEQLYRRNGYVKIFGTWIHRSNVTFAVYSLFATITGTWCATMIFATTAWTWLYASIALVLLLTLWVWLYKRVRN